MSAIWGMFDDDNLIDELENQLMEEPFHHCRIDEFRHKQDSHLLLGYGNQLFTTESEYEEQPFLLENYSFTADVVLDNRDELLQKLKWTSDQGRISDGTILFEILVKYGFDCLQWVRGSFSFFFYDKNKNQIIMATDSVGSRVLYYSYEQNVLCFATLQEAVKAVWRKKGRKIEWNERFLSDLIALDDLTLLYEPAETAVLGLYKIEPGQAIVIQNKKLSKQYYWDPAENIKENCSMSDEECKKEFRELWKSCVSDCLRTKDNVGILLSGGLDSTAVACFAAASLSEKRKKLYSYTSIPEKDFKYEGNPYYISNERKAVEATADFLGNVECHFLDLPGKDGWQNAASYAHEIEMPFKSLQNQCWMEECLIQARKDQCSIILTGQYGNTTVSYGDFATHFATLLCSGKLSMLYHEINAFHEKTRYSRKLLYKEMLEWIPRRLKEKHVQPTFDNVYVSKELIRKYNTKERFLKKGMNQNRGTPMTIQEYRPFMAYRNALSHIGEMETKDSLYRGVLMRDPTRDKRLIEFCMSLPEEYFVKNGVARRLVYDYLGADIPEHILKNRNRKGLQSADTQQRLAKNWKLIYPQLEKLLESEEAKHFLDIRKSEEELKLLKDPMEMQDTFEILKFLSSLLMIQFIQQN